MGDTSVTDMRHCLDEFGEFGRDADAALDDPRGRIIAPCRLGLSCRRVKRERWPT
jgi:hypothetical protein